jgi:hypothetical protein
MGLNIDLVDPAFFAVEVRVALKITLTLQRRLLASHLAVSA